MGHPAESCSEDLRNFISTLRMVWRAAKSWRYVGILNPFEDLKLPNSGLPTSAALTAKEAKALVLKADGEFRLMLWLLAEPGFEAEIG